MKKNPKTNSLKRGRGQSLESKNKPSPERKKSTSQSITEDNKESERQEKRIKTLHDLKATSKLLPSSAILPLYEDLSFFIVGFPIEASRLLFTLIIRTGGTVFCQYSPNISAVIVGDSANEAYIKLLKKESPSLKFITAEQFVQNVKAKSRKF